MVFKKIYDKILNSSNSFKFYKNHYNKLKLENKQMWKDIRHKDKVIKDKDDLINLRNSQIKDKDNKIKNQNSTIDSKNKAIQDKDNQIREKNNQIKQKENYIKQHDSQVNELKKDIELLKAENKNLLRENKQLFNHNFDLRKAIDENKNLRHEFVKTTDELNKNFETINSRSNKILSFIEFSQVEASNSFSELTSNIEDNMEILSEDNKQIQKHLGITQEE